MKLAGLTMMQLAGAVLVGLAIAGAITYMTAPQPVYVPVQVITPVPTPPPVVIQPTYTYGYGGAGGQGYTVIVGGGGGAAAPPVSIPIQAATPDDGFSSMMQAFNVAAIALVMLGVMLIIGGAMMGMRR
jgi:hypothetical protein